MCRVHINYLWVLLYLFGGFLSPVFLLSLFDLVLFSLNIQKLPTMAFDGFWKNSKKNEGAEQRKGAVLGPGWSK